MKHSVKITLFIAAGLILLGLALMVASVVLGLAPASLEDMSTVGITVVQSHNGSSDPWESYESSNVYEVETKNISSLSVDWAFGRVEIVPWEENVIQIAEVANMERIAEKDALRWRVDDTGTLHIEYAETSKGIPITRPDKALQVLVPEELAENWQTLHVSAASATVAVSGMKAAKLDVSTASGDMELTELTAETVSLSAASGDIAFTGDYGRLQAGTASGDVSVQSLGAARETEIDTTSGRIGVTGECGELSLESTSGNITAAAVTVREVDVNSTSGKVELELLSCPDELDVETTSGNVELTLPADSGFRLEFDHTSGDMDECDFPLSRDRGQYIAGDGRCEFSVDTTSGDLTIRKGA